MRKSKIQEAINKAVLVYYKNGYTNTGNKFRLELIRHIMKYLNKKNGNRR
jgi:hypothetical protein